MQRTFASLLGAAILALPVDALASSPSDLLHKTMWPSAPQEFSLHAHNSANGVHASLWANGAHEGWGTDWYKQKSAVTMHIDDGGSRLELKLKLVVHGDMLYVGVKEATRMHEGMVFNMHESLWQKNWAVIPVRDIAADHGPFPFLTLISYLDLDLLNVSEAWDGIVENADSLLAAEHTAYQGGSAYSLKPAQGPANLHIKLNTGKHGDVLFMKQYFAHGNFVMQGTAQPHGKAVHVEKPTNTISEEAFWNAVEESPLTEVLGEYDVAYWNVDWLWGEGPLFPHIGGIADTGRDAPDYTSPGIRPSVDLPSSFYNWPDCTAEPGTSAYTQQQRRGACPGDRLHKRAVNMLSNDRSRDRDGFEIWQDRVEEERLIEAYDAIMSKFEEASSRKNMHLAKNYLSRHTLSDFGSEDIDDWMKMDVIPFFVPATSSWILHVEFIEDEEGLHGAALEKVVLTESGNQKKFVAVIMEEDEGDEPVITDLFTNTTLRELKREGLFE